MIVVLRLTEAAVEFKWWVGWGLQIHFRVQPNTCVEVVLRCGVGVGVVTIVILILHILLLFGPGRIIARSNGKNSNVAQKVACIYLFTQIYNLLQG